MLSSIRSAQSRISAIEQRLGTMRTSSSTSFDAALASELEAPPEGTVATSDWAVGGTQAMSVGDDAATLASWLGTLTASSGGTAAAATTDLATVLGGTASTGVAGVTGGLTPAVPRAPGDYERLAAPAELEPYGNGQIPTEALAPIGVGAHRLWAPAATAFQQMSAAAAADGVTIGVTDSYRSYDSQVDLARRKGLYSQGGLAATPGTSNHGWGLALDLDLDDSAQAWMNEHGWQYGFVESVPREPWHWEYRPAGMGS